VGFFNTEGNDQSSSGEWRQSPLRLYSRYSCNTAAECYFTDTVVARIRDIEVAITTQRQTGGFIESRIPAHTIGSANHILKAARDG
jgi:hypothetical protein